MLHRDANLSFAGGAWVFPGGRVDPDDYPPGVERASADDDAKLVAARNAAAREALEEAGLEVDASALVWFAHWTPEASVPRRFATWFFVARAPEGAVTIDDGEIRAHEWVAPAEVLRRHDAGEISLFPPTWMTLRLLAAADVRRRHVGSAGCRGSVGLRHEDRRASTVCPPPCGTATPGTRTATPNVRDRVTACGWTPRAGASSSRPELRTRVERGSRSPRPFSTLGRVRASCPVAWPFAA